MNFSQITQVGRLTAEPEVSSLSTGTTLVKLTIATNHKYNGKEDTTFIDVKFFGDQNARVADYFHKGDNILVTGELRQEKWEKDGIKYSRHVIMGNRWTFVDNKGTGAGQQVGASSQGSEQQGTRRNQGAGTASQTQRQQAQSPAQHSQQQDMPVGYDPFADDIEPPF